MLILTDPSGDLRLLSCCLSLIYEDPFHGQSADGVPLTPRLDITYRFHATFYADP